MTIIVYRDGIMAADSLVTGDDLRQGRSTKIIRTREGWLAGGSGTLAAATLFLEWMRAGHKAGEMDTVGAADNLNAVAISPAGLIFSVDGCGVLSPIQDEFFAVGSGRTIAIGALEMGATAEQAVEVTIRRDVGCGPPIITLQLKDRRAWRRKQRK